MNSRHSGQRRRRSGRNRQSSSPRSGDTFHVRREPRKPAGLWDKIKAFFGLAPQSAAKPTASANGHERRERTRDEIRAPRESRPPREPRAPRESRKPESIEVTTPRLYVGNLSYDAGESDLFELFSGVGTVANVEIVTNKHTQRSKGFGFVQMNAISEAKRAVDELHDKEYMGRKLVVSGAKLPADRSIGRDREDSASSEDNAEEPASQV
jgi:RNA recognition motif-containing protein